MPGGRRSKAEEQPLVGARGPGGYSSSNSSAGRRRARPARGTPPRRHAGRAARRPPPPPSGASPVDLRAARAAPPSRALTRSRRPSAAGLLRRRPAGGVCARRAAAARPGAASAARGRGARRLTPDQRPQAAEEPAHRVERLDLRARGVPAGPAVVRGVRRAQPRLQRRRRARPRAARRARSPAPRNSTHLLTRPRWSTLKKARPARQPGTPPLIAWPMAVERGEPAAQVRVARLQLAQPRHEAARRRRSAAGSGKAASTVTVAPVARRPAPAPSPAARGRAPRRRVRTFTPLRPPRALARERLEGARRARACDPGMPVSASWRSASASSIATVAASRPACQTARARAGRHEPPVRHQEREVPARPSPPRSPRRSARRNGSEPVKLTSRRASPAELGRPPRAQAAASSSSPADSARCSQRWQKDSQRGRELPRAVDGLARAGRRGRAGPCFAAPESARPPAAHGRQSGSPQKPPGTSSTSRTTTSEGHVVGEAPARVVPEQQPHGRAAPHATLLAHAGRLILRAPRAAVKRARPRGRPARPAGPSVSAGTPNRRRTAATVSRCDVTSEVDRRPPPPASASGTASWSASQGSTTASSSSRNAQEPSRRALPHHLRAQAPLAEQRERGAARLEHGLDLQERPRGRRGEVHDVPLGLDPSLLPQERPRRVGRAPRHVAPQPRRARDAADGDERAPRATGRGSPGAPTGATSASSRPSPRGKNPARSSRRRDDEAEPSHDLRPVPREEVVARAAGHVRAPGDLDPARPRRRRQDRAATACRTRVAAPAVPMSKRKSPRPTGARGEAQVGRAVEGPVDLGAAAQGRRADGREVLRAAGPGRRRVGADALDAEGLARDRRERERRAEDLPPALALRPVERDRGPPAATRRRSPSGWKQRRQRASYWPGPAHHHPVLGRRRGAASGWRAPRTACRRRGSCPRTRRPP